MAPKPKDNMAPIPKDNMALKPKDNMTTFQLSFYTQIKVFLKIIMRLVVFCNGRTRNLQNKST